VTGFENAEYYLMLPPTGSA